MSYATPADLKARKDVRTIGDLVSDDDLRTEPVDLDSSDVLLALLAEASGEVEAALMQGKRYSVDDLESLTGNSLAYLKSIVCEVTWGKLWSRRGYSDQQEEALNAGRKALERLRKGEHVFNLEDQKEAGLPDITGPTRVEREQLNTIASRSRGHFYPREQLPFNR